MEGICSGFRPGASSLKSDGTSMLSHNVTSVPPLARDDDPEGWHLLAIHSDVHMRHARRIDVWVGDVIEIDATFQDSASVPEGGRVVIHEYTLQATADPKTQTLLSVSASRGACPIVNVLAPRPTSVGWWERRSRNCGPRR